ncbi:MAG: substrate-binding domain-containing protein [Eubacterium sp.]|nr:substrate-binding domain-containing protein [Eubacterium sp.]
MRGKKIRSCALLLSLVLLISACAANQPDEPKEPERPYVIAITKAMNSLHWLSVQEGMEHAADNFGVDLTVRWPKDEDNIDVQMQILEDVIKAKPDALAIAPCAPEIILQNYKKIQEAGISLFYMDEEPVAGAPAPYVGSDNYHAGELAACELAAALPDGAEVAVIGGDKHLTAHARRMQGFSDTVRGETSMTCTAEREVAGVSVEGGRDAMRQLLNEYPQISGVFCGSAMLVMGALEACEEAGRSDILLVGMDTQSDALSALEEGKLLAMVSQNGYEIGSETIRRISEELSGGQVPEYTYVDNDVITQDTAVSYMDAYMTEERT